jgi:hypothetical protein
MTTPSPYSIPLDELESSANIPAAEQVEVQEELRFFGDAGDRDGVLPAGGGLDDADGG